MKAHKLKMNYHYIITGKSTGKSIPFNCVPQVNDQPELNRNNVHENQRQSCHNGLKETFESETYSYTVHILFTVIFQFHLPITSKHFLHLRKKQAFLFLAPS